MFDSCLKLLGDLLKNLTDIASYRNEKDPTLKMEAVWFSKTLVSFYKITQCQHMTKIWAVVALNTSELAENRYTHPCFPLRGLRWSWWNVCNLYNFDTEQYSQNSSQNSNCYDNHSYLIINQHISFLCLFTGAFLSYELRSWLVLILQLGFFGPLPPTYGTW